MQSVQQDLLPIRYHLEKKHTSDVATVHLAQIAPGNRVPHFVVLLKGVSETAET